MAERDETRDVFERILGIATRKMRRSRVRGRDGGLFGRGAVALAIEQGGSHERKLG